ncbi:MAG: NAD(+) diphosphatase [Burkholderiales bacterium]|jgi:NAD+ diphosphatase|nr:NAD(+) diphosphatase [Burkholderiales bacterium]
MQQELTLLALYDNKILAINLDNSIELPKHYLLTQFQLQHMPIVEHEGFLITQINASLTLDLLPKHYSFITLRTLLNNFADDFNRKIICLYELANYYLLNKYCSTCGTLNTLKTNQKFVYCPNCNKENYPQISPCIIVRIHKEDKILLARGKNFPPQVYGLIAGFVEIGETIEEAVIREVEEEVGIQIDNIKYWGSQSWPFPSNSLMLGFTAQYKSGNIVVDHEELNDANFYTAANIPGYPSTKTSIAQKMIDEFKLQHSK